MDFEPRAFGGLYVASDGSCLMARVRSQWKAPKKREVELNEACWQCPAEYYLGSTSASPTGTSYRVVTYIGLCLAVGIFREGLGVDTNVSFEPWLFRHIESE
jgi:hypothetical protein